MLMLPSIAMLALVTQRQIDKRIARDSQMKRKIDLQTDIYRIRHKDMQGQTDRQRNRHAMTNTQTRHKKLDMTEQTDG